MRTRLVGSVLSFLFALATPALAQQGTSEIGGRVARRSGRRPCPASTSSSPTRRPASIREVTSGADGSYFASQLTPGRYRISAKLASFRTFERGGLVLAVGKTLTIDVTLALGALEETVTRRRPSRRSSTRRA